MLRVLCVCVMCVCAAGCGEAAPDSPALGQSPSGTRRAAPPPPSADQWPNRKPVHAAAIAEDVERPTLLATFPTGIAQAAFPPLESFRELERFAVGDRSGWVNLFHATSEARFDRWIRAPKHETWFNSMAYARDGRRLAAGSEDKVVKLWDTDLGKIERDLTTVDFSPYYLSWSADGRQLLIGGQKMVEIWNCEEAPKQVARWAVLPSGLLKSPVWLPDGESILFGLVTPGPRSLVEFDVKAGRVKREFNTRGYPVTALALSSDGRFAAAAAPSDILVFDLASGALAGSLPAKNDYCAFSHDARRVICGEIATNKLTVWDVPACKMEFEFATQHKVNRKVSLSPDGRFAIVAADLSLFDVWQLPEPKSEAAWPEAAPPALAASSQGAAPATNDADAQREVARRVAVLTFVDQGSSIELAPLRFALAEMLSGSLAEYQAIETVERVRVAGLLGESELDRSGLVDQPSLDQTARSLAADYLVSGTFAGRQDAITVEARLTQLGRSEPLGVWQWTAARDELPSLEADIAGRVLEALEVPSTLRPPPAVVDGEPPVAAVLPLANLSMSAERDVLAAGMTDLLQAGLAAVPQVRLVERSMLDRVLDEQKLTLADLAAPEKAAEVGRLVRAERLVHGMFVEIGDQFQMVTRVIDAASGRVVGSSKVSGAKEVVAPLLERLTVAVAEDLSLAVPAEARAAIREAAPARKLESAIHAASAARFIAAGRIDEAEASYERAILVEPRSFALRVQLAEVLSRLERADDLVRVCEQALALDTAQRFPIMQRQILPYLAAAYRALGRSDDLASATDRLRAIDTVAAEASDSSGDTLLTQSFSLSNRDPKLLESIDGQVEAARASGDRMRLGNALVAQYMALTAALARAAAAEDPETESKRVAAQLVSIHDELLDAARDLDDVRARTWSQIVMYTQQLGYADANGRPQYYLNTEQRLDVLRRGMEAFSWYPEAVAPFAFLAATIADQDERWEEALESYQTFLRADVRPYSDGLPALMDWNAVDPSDWFTRLVESRFRSAEILHRKLRRSDEAKPIYLALARDEGLVHYRGAQTLAALRELGLTPPALERAILVWGGGYDAVRSWRQLLGANALVHAAHTYHVTAAELAPYRMVVLARTGHMPYDPADILALRSYVATGGSLLAIVSDAYEPAQPSLHASLLDFFGMSIGDAEPRDHAQTTRIEPHPWTQGIQQLSVRYFVPIEVRDAVGLVFVGDDAALATATFGHGRVVIASFGQWFLPDPRVIYGGNEGVPRYDHWTATRTLQDLPLGSANAPETRLLRSAVAWLSEPHGAEQAAAVKEFQTARARRACVCSSKAPTTSIGRAIRRAAARRIGWPTGSLSG